MVIFKKLKNCYFRRATLENEIEIVLNTFREHFQRDQESRCIQGGGEKQSRWELFSAFSPLENHFWEIFLYAPQLCYC